MSKLRLYKKMRVEQSGNFSWIGSRYYWNRLLIWISKHHELISTQLCGYAFRFAKWVNPYTFEQLVKWAAKPRIEEDIYDW